MNLAVLKGKSAQITRAGHFADNCKTFFFVGENNCNCKTMTRIDFGFTSQPS